MTGRHSYKIKYKRNIRGLDVLQAVFAFVMALGLREVFIGSYNFFSVIIFSETDFFTAKKILFLILFLNIVLLGMRFFWVPRSLRRLVYEAAGQADTPPTLPNLRNWEVSLHVFIILLQGMIFYLMGSEFEFIAFMMSSSTTLDASVFSGYVLMHISLLVANFLWLGMIQRRRNRIRRKLGIHSGQTDRVGSEVWFRNNLVCSVLALGPFVVAGHCQSNVYGCASTTGPDTLLPLPMWPSSPVVISMVYDLLEPAITGFSTWFGDFNESGRISLVLWVFCILLANSAWDLLRTGKYYLVLEDIDWEYSADPPDPNPNRAGHSGGY